VLILKRRKRFWGMLGGDCMVLQLLALQGARGLALRCACLHLA